MRPSDPQHLLAAARAGDRGALGRLISLIERGGPPGRTVGRLAFTAAAGLGRVIGITGAPGAGKSSLTDALITRARRDGSSVGVLAVDPSSPFSGGALLGDRVRMQRHATDDGVFIRSMATRGHLGGLALAAPEAVRVLAAAGLDVVLVETVGVGQVEIEVAANADTTVVVLNPGWGDAIQASKAGLLEVADVFVVNKADRPGAPETRRDLEAMLDRTPSLPHPTNGAEWRTPIVATVATADEGIEELWAVLAEHDRFLHGSGELELRRSERLRRELAEVVVRRVEHDVRALSGGARWAEVAAEVAAGRLDPYEAAEVLLSEARFRPG